jgi:hypothetical protein
MLPILPPVLPILPPVHLRPPPVLPHLPPVLPHLSHLPPVLPRLRPEDHCLLLRPSLSFIEKNYVIVVRTKVS